MYESAVTSLNKQLDAATADSDADDPFVILTPFIKKEITAPYIQLKSEKLIDDTAHWMGGGSAVPVVSFSDLKEKLIKQHASLIEELESAVVEMESAVKEANTQEVDAAGQFTASDLKKFLQSDFTIPVGQYLFSMKLIVRSIWILLVASAALICFNLLCIFLIAAGLQSKLRWMGTTFLLTALWNIPGAFIGAGSSVVLATVLTKNMHGIAEAIARQCMEILIHPMLLSYTRITGGAVIALGILSFGMIILAFFLHPTEVYSVPPVPQKTKKRK